MSADTMVAVSESPTPLGKRLKSAREEAHLGTNQLNKLVRLPDGRTLSDGYISSIETGRRVNIEAVYGNAIAQALGVRPEWLISGTEPRKYASGELPAYQAPKVHPKPNLELVLSTMNARGRWSNRAIIAARAQEHDAPPAAWPNVLDGLEKALQPIHDLKRR